MYLEMRWLRIYEMGEVWREKRQLRGRSPKR